MPLLRSYRYHYEPQRDSARETTRYACDVDLENRAAIMYHQPSDSDDQRGFDGDVASISGVETESARFSRYGDEEALCRERPRPSFESRVRMPTVASNGVVIVGAVTPNTWMTIEHEDSLDEKAEVRFDENGFLIELRYLTSSGIHGDGYVHMKFHSINEVGPLEVPNFAVWGE